MVRSMNDLMDMLVRELPGSTVEEDNEGQLIIYTNRKSAGDSDTDLISLDEEET